MPRNHHQPAVLRGTPPAAATLRAAQIAVISLMLGACGGNFQAPVFERSERQVRIAPIIVDSSSPDSSLYAPSSRPTISSSSAAGNRPTSSTSPATGNSVSTHRVGRGDTLYKIAFQYDLDVRNLARANSLSPPYTIFVGQILNLDVSRIEGGQSSLVSTLGIPVDNNSVARSQAGISRSSGVQRRPIGDSGTEPRWQWPHGGRLLRGFQSDVNEGIDIGGLRGDPVLAAGAGEVVYAGSDIQGSGDLIIIRHSDSYLSAYAHNSVMLVNEGSQVSAGQQIAEVGENPGGIAMLHFEIRQNGKSVDPAIFLPAR